MEQFKQSMGRVPEDNQNPLPPNQNISPETKNILWSNAGFNRPSASLDTLDAHFDKASAHLDKAIDVAENLETNEEHPSKKLIQQAKEQARQELFTNIWRLKNSSTTNVLDKASVLNSLSDFKTEINLEGHTMKFDMESFKDEISQMIATVEKNIQQGLDKRTDI